MTSGHTNGCACRECQLELFLLNGWNQKLLTQHHVWCEANSDHLIDLEQDDARCDCGATSRKAKLRELGL